MSDLFMDMHRRRRRSAASPASAAAATAGSNNSFISSSAYDDHIGGSSTLTPSDDANEAEDEVANILNLKLKKPKHWNWELSTSRSCMNIALPRILLYDHKGNLLVDANSQEEQVYKPPTEKHKQYRTESRKRAARAATTNLAHSIRQALNQEFDGLHIQEATPSLHTPTTSSYHTRNSSPAGNSSSCIDFYTNDLPDYKFERRSSSLKGVRFKEDDSRQTPTTTPTTATTTATNSFQFVGLPTPPPSSGTTPTTGTSSSSGPREKRRYRRSQSSGRSPVNSPSILERFSYSRGRFSSPEYAEEHDVYHAPRYFLRTSKAGTLVVQEDSFSRCRRRRLKARNSSSENIQIDGSPRSRSTGSVKTASNASTPQRLQVHEHPTSPQSGSLQNVAEPRERRRKKTLPVRRYRSDGNILLQNLSTSEEDLNRTETKKGDENAENFAARSPQRRYEQLKRHLKSDLVPIHPDNGVYRPFGSPTER